VEVMMDLNCVKIFLIFVLVCIAMLASVTYIYNSANARHEPGHRLDFPDSIAIDPSNGNVFVGINTGGFDKIQKFTNNGKFIRDWNLTREGFGNPLDIAVDKSGNVFVISDGIHIRKFSNAGKFITKWDPPTIAFLIGIAVDKSGNVFVTDVQESRVLKFTNNGTFLGEWGGLGSGEGQFKYPIDIAVDPSGYVFVTEVSNQRILKFTNTGKFIRDWGEKGDEKGEFRNPMGIAVDKSGNVFVADDNNYRIQKFTNTGKFIRQWGSEGSGNGQFYDPLDLAVDSSGNVFVADLGNHSIQKFTNTGKFITKWNVSDTTIANVNVFAMRE
jgi:tripartite motif-containing protein 71